MSMSDECPFYLFGFLYHHAEAFPYRKGKQVVEFKCAFTVLAMTTELEYRAHNLLLRATPVR